MTLISRMVLMLSLAYGLVMALAINAQAGDVAQRDLIGYSSDGRYFAFEEYGIQDGSGFAFSNIFVIDTANDKWVSGSPIRLQANDESRSLRNVRNKTRSDYRTQFGRPLRIFTPAITIAANALGEFDAPEMDRINFALPTYATQMEPGDLFPTRTEVQLAIEHKRLPSSSDCADIFGTNPYGLALWANIEGSGPQLIHEDTRVPRSRGCVMSYQISEVVVPMGAETLKDALALISIYAFGFEGPDRRFLAAPLHLQ